MKRFIFSLAILFAQASGYALENTHTRLNLGFIENKGQLIDQKGGINSTVKFIHNSDGFNTEIKNGSFSYDTYSLRKSSNSNIKPIYDFHRIDIELLNANWSNCIPDKASNVFYQDNKKIKCYQSLLYKNIYPNIDLQFISMGGKMKYNFIVHSGGNIKNIRWKYFGSSEILIHENKIRIGINGGAIEESIPESYILGKEGKKFVNVFYKKNQRDEYGFSEQSEITLGSTETLVIDPMPNLIWATYYGGGNVDFISSNAVDQTGNIYVIGYSSSTTSMTTVGSFQTSYGGGANDIILAKFSPSGAMKWATYFGRSGDDQGSSIALDNKNGVYISGLTSSIGMSSSSNYQVAYGGGPYDAFLAKFDTLGVLTWFTYYGGSGHDESYGCSVDKSGDIYITGSTSSTNAISTAGAFQTTFSGGTYDNYIAKFNSNGFRIWGTYYGGPGDEGTTACVSDTMRNLYIVGYTTSSSGLSTIGSHQSSQGGNYDAFLCKFDKLGNRIWSTYYGGSGLDCGNTVAFDTLTNSVYIGGYSASVASIATSGSFQFTKGAGDDGFISKFDPNGVRLWGTYYGNSGTDWINDIVVDSTNIYFVGLTSSAAGISTPLCFKTSYSGGNDVYFGKFDKNGQRLWCSYFGGNNYELGSSIVKDKMGSIYVSGCTGSFNNIATPGSYQTIYAGTGYDGFLAKFNEAVSTSIQVSEFSLENIMIFPNPSASSIIINGNKDFHLHLYNSLGIKLKEIFLSAENNFSVKIEDLESGIYFISNDTPHNGVRKIIISK